MKAVCPICGTRRGQRSCRRQSDGGGICPLCCAGKRDENCGDCEHFKTARRYQSSRDAETRRAEGHFVNAIHPEVEKAVNEALQLIEQRKFGQARTALTALLRDHPQNHQVFFAMGTLHALEEKHKEAVGWFDQATAINPFFVEAHFNKAMAYVKKFDIANAVRAFRKVIEVGEPGEPETQHAQTFITDMAATIRETSGIDLDAYLESQDAFNRAYELMERGAWPEALAGFRTAAALNDRNAPTHGNLGICLAQLGRKAEALAELDRALELDPRYEPAAANRLVIEKLVEGQTLGGMPFKSIEFSKEQLLRDRQWPLARARRNIRSLWEFLAHDGKRGGVS